MKILESYDNTRYLKQLEMSPGSESQVFLLKIYLQEIKDVFERLFKGSSTDLASEEIS